MIQRWLEGGIAGSQEGKGERRGSATQVCSDVSCGHADVCSSIVGTTACTIETLAARNAFSEGNNGTSVGDDATMKRRAGSHKHTIASTSKVGLCRCRTQEVGKHQLYCWVVGRFFFAQTNQREQEHRFHIKIK